MRICSQTALLWHCTRKTTFTHTDMRFTGYKTSHCHLSLRAQLLTSVLFLCRVSSQFFQYIFLAVIGNIQWFLQQVSKKISSLFGQCLYKPICANAKVVRGYIRGVIFFLNNLLGSGSVRSRWVPCRGELQSRPERLSRRQYSRKRTSTS